MIERLLYQAHKVALFLMAPLFIALFVLPSSSTAQEPAKVKKVQVGVITPLSGDFARFGEIVKSGILAAPNSHIEFIFEDEQCSAKEAIAAYKRLRQRGINLFIGPSCGAGQSSLAPLVANDDVLVMLASSASTELFQKSDKKMFSSQVAIETEARFVANAMSARGLRNVVIVFVEGEFGRAHEAAFKASFEGKVVDTIAIPAFDPNALRAILPSLKNIDHDGVFIPDVSPFLLGLRRQMELAFIPARPMYSIYSAQSEDLLVAEGQAADGLIYSYPYIERDALEYFPYLAAQMVNSAVRQCADDLVCIRKEWNNSNQFDADGVLASPLALRHIVDGKFVPLEIARAGRGKVQ